MALQMTVARAVGEWIVKQHMAFIRTAKGGRPGGAQNFPAFWEAILGSLLVAGAGLVYMTNYENVVEINLFAAVLLVQSLPFVAATALASLERTPLNNPEFIPNLFRVVGELRPRRSSLAAPASEPAPVLARTFDDIPAL
jgi:glucan 1,3-beta-glucosidase